MNPWGMSHPGPRMEGRVSVIRVSSGWFVFPANLLSGDMMVTLFVQ